jgi:hypothetical protein
MKRFVLVFTVLTLFLAGCSEKTTEPLPTVAVPEFSIPSGVYGTPILVTITCVTAGAEIRYTADGENPTANSPVYEEPLIITETIQIKARAFKEGWTTSETATLDVAWADDQEYNLEFVDIPATHPLDTELTVIVRVFDDEDNPALDGVLITFLPTEEMGFYEDQEEGGHVHAHVNEGYASVVWTSGTVSGSAVLGVAQGLSVDGGVLLYDAVEAEVMLIPDPPASISLSFEEPFRVRAEVKDQFENRVLAGVDLVAEISMGEIQDSAETDDDGIAYFNLYMGNESGSVTVTVSTLDGSVSAALDVVIPSDEVATIVFADEDDIFLDVRDAEGIESVDLHVNLLDSNGLLVSGQHFLLFEIIGSTLGGANINSSGSSDQVLSNDGVAIATLNSGTQSGALNVKVSLIDDPAIFSLKDNIFIRPGPAHNIEITAGGYDSGVNMGEGLWTIQVLSETTDIHGNYVIDGTVINYSIEAFPELPPQTSIEAEVTTIEGIATAELTYHGQYTNSEVSVTATAGEASALEMFALPLNNPQITMELDPAFIDIHPDDPLDSLYIAINLTLADGQGSQITDSDFLMTASHGVFEYYEWFDDAGNPVNSPASLQMVSSYQGVAKGLLRLRAYEIHFPEEEWFTTMDVMIGALLAGTDIFVETALTIRIYGDLEPGGEQ